MPASLRCACCFLLLASAGLRAQTTVEDREILDRDRPEAWAMNHAAASSLMTAFGPMPALESGHWNLGFELGSIPRLSARQRAVGFNGSKTEDLNKSPAFGRVRLFLGLPKAWVAELGYTPPIAINGTQARGLFSASLGRTWLTRESWSLSSRVFGQHGSVVGDITCPADLAGVLDPQINPYGCQEPSRDRVRLNYYGAELQLAGRGQAWQWHAGAGAVRTELSVQLDALTFSYRDRSYLSASGHLGFFAAGLQRRLAPHWDLGAQLVYVPIPVRREPASSSSNEAMTSLRLQLLYRRD